MKKNITKYNFKTGLPQEFEIADISQLYKDFKRGLTTTHRTGFYHIIWFQEGSPTHIVDFNPIKIKPNTFLFLNKDVVQQFDAKSIFTGKVIMFTDSFFCKSENDTKFLKNSVLFNNLFTTSQIQISEKTKHFEDIIALINNELKNNKDNFQSDIIQNFLHNFLLYSERECNNQNTNENKTNIDLNYVMLFKDCLEIHYKTQRQVNYYAKKLIISEKRLNLATSKILGKTPKELINERVLLEAKRILAYTTESVKEISYHLGFEEPTNFIKYFKKHSESTPTEFREKNTMA